MKGTYIKVLNDVVFDELAKVKVSAENTSRYECIKTKKK